MGKNDGGPAFWVIERYHGDDLYYWSARDSSIVCFERDIQFAIKLFDKQSGEQILHRQLHGIGRVVQHKFLAAREGPANG